MTDARSATTSNAFTQIPTRFTTRDLTVGSRALGETCLSRAEMPDRSVCNPAFLGEVEESTLLGRVFIGNGYSAFSTANSLIFEPISKEFLQQYFTENNVTTLEAHVGILFTAKHFSAGFSPYRIQYVSEGHNPNFPVVAVHAALERGFSFSGGTGLESLGEGWEAFSVGARAQLIERRFVHGSFTLFQAITDTPRALLPIQTQKVAFIDPFVGWKARERLWNLRASLGTQNLGFHSFQSPLYPEPADFQAGVGVEPPLGFGQLRLGLDLRDILHGSDAESRVRLGGSYRFGIVEAMTGWSADAWTIGAQLGIQIIQVGIVYELMRQDLDGLSADNRIATEISIAL